MSDVTVDTGALAAETARQLGTFTQRLGTRIALEAQGGAPERTGRMRRAIASDGVTSHGPWVLSTTVTVDVPYAAAIHEGSRPHIIRARNAPVLVFFWRGAWRYRKSVRHPGTRSNPFLTRAAEYVLSSDPRIST